MKWRPTWGLFVQVRVKTISRDAIHELAESHDHFKMDRKKAAPSDKEDDLHDFENEDQETMDQSSNDAKSLLGENKNTQWRPTPSDQLLQALLDKLTLSSNQTPPILPSYRGEPTEDPKQYLSSCESVFNSRNISRDEWVHQAAAQLKGTAAQWWDQYEPLNIT